MTFANSFDPPDLDPNNYTLTVFLKDTFFLKINLKKIFNFKIGASIDSGD